MRIRLTGGRLSGRALLGLSRLAQAHGDGRVRLTSRANLQLRALPHDEYAAGRLREDLVTAIEELGLLPSRTHDLVRNVMLSPESGLAGGRADLRPLAEALDAAVRGDARLATLPAKFLLTLDDGRGDLMGRETDLGLVALSGTDGQLRVGGGWGPVVRLEEAAPALLALAHRFLDVRGRGPSAAWHVDELSGPLTAPVAPDGRLPDPAGPLAYGAGPAGDHVAAVDGALSPALVDAIVDRLTDPDDLVVVTPWRGVLVPKETR